MSLSVCPPNISETVAVRITKLARRPRNCLYNDQTHLKTNFTVHFINFIKNNSANRRWLEAHIVAVMCCLPMIRPTPFVSFGAAI